MPTEYAGERVVSSGGGLLSVGLTLPSIFTVSGSPITGTGGTITADFASHSPNLFLASPSLSSGALTMRGIESLDLATALETPPDIGITTPALVIYVKDLIVSNFSKTYGGQFKAVPTNTVALKDYNGIGPGTLNTGQVVATGLNTGVAALQVNMTDAVSATLIQAIAKDAVGAGLVFFEQYGENASASEFYFRKTRGTFAAPTPANSGDFVGLLSFQSYASSAWRTVAQVAVYAAENISSSAHGGQVNFNLTRKGGTELFGAFTLNSEQQVYQIKTADTTSFFRYFDYQHTSSGTATTGFGFIKRYRGQVSDGSVQTISQDIVFWDDGAAGTRKGARVMYVGDATTDYREVLRAISSGSEAKLAFYGETPAARASHIADPSGGTTIDTQARTAINSILVALENIGILKKS